MTEETSILDLLQKEKQVVTDYNMKLYLSEQWTKDGDWWREGAKEHTNDSYCLDLAKEYDEKAKKALDEAQSLLKQIQEVRLQIHEKIL